MKRLKRAAVIALLALALTFCAVYAENNVSEIDISVTLCDDGSARIIQNWHGTFDEGTENYIPIATDGIEISDFRVSDSEGEYIFTENWDIDAGFDEKKRKCGINETEDGVELCFGISNYGEKSYAIEYTVADFIKGYSDFDGTNFMLINRGMSTFPTDGKIRITMQNGTELNEENAAIWAFGYDGEIEFLDGGVSAYTTAPLEGDNSMIVMLQLEHGIISPETVLPQSFEDVKNAAFEGSDYGYDDEASLLEIIIGFAVLFILFAVLVLIIFLIVRRRREIKEFCRNANYFRDTPCDGRIEISHFLARDFGVSGSDSLIIGALLLSMINKGCLETQTDESTGVFGKVKQSVNLRLVREPDTDIERSLYTLISAAAGADGVLQEKELENYGYANPKSVNGFIDSAKESGRAKFASCGGYLGAAGRRIKDLSVNGRKMLGEVVGLKKYLEDFSLIAEREIKETIIWQDYMVYAALFGIADKVMKQLERVYPDRIPELEDYNRQVIIAHSYYRSIYGGAVRAEQEARSEGMGGHSSIGGGGGFSGGGYGGGSR